MARALTQSCRRILPHRTPSRWWLEQPLEPSYLPLKLLPEVKAPGIICVRFLSAQAQAQAPASTPAQARQTGAVKVSLTSPGFVGDPYSPGEPISFWHRCFTRSGWKRTKEEFVSQLKSAYAIAKVRRKYGHSKQKFYEETTHLYREVQFCHLGSMLQHQSMHVSGFLLLIVSMSFQINILMANGDKNSMRKLVTETMYSALKNEIKRRETVWPHVYWELIMPIVKIRTLRARLIGTDKNDVMKSFAQITIEFLSKQKFEAYNSNGAVVAGDKDKEVLVRDIWVFERSLFHHGSYWRLCGRVKV